MKRALLQPKQLIVPGEYDIGNEHILKIYHRFFAQSPDYAASPIIAIHKDSGDFYSGCSLCPTDVNYENNRDRQRRYEALLMRAYRGGAEFFLLDGNHKAIAATLCRKQLSALLIEDDADLERCGQMVMSGDLLDWPLSHTTIEQVTNSLREHIQRLIETNECRDRPTALTVQERVDELIANGDLPVYMAKEYMQSKHVRIRVDSE